MSGRVVGATRVTRFASTAKFSTIFPTLHKFTSVCFIIICLLVLFHIQMTTHPFRDLQVSMRAQSQFLSHAQKVGSKRS